MNIFFRSAQPNDKAAITALAAKIWEGEDYLHKNFDNWLAQERGRFVVAYEGENLVGCNKLTEFRIGEWWMEGLRVDPDWRGKGIARLLHENILNITEEILAVENLSGTIRLATDSENYPVHKLALGSGFGHTNRHFLYRADIPTDKPLEIEETPFVPVSPSEKAAVEDWFGRSAYFAASKGLFEDTWKWYEIRPRLDTLLRDGRLFWWQKDGQVAGLLGVHHRDPETMVVNYLDSPDGRWAELMADARLLARTYKVSQIKSKPLALPEIKLALPHTGWEIDYDLEMWVFERPIG